MVFRVAYIKPDVRFHCQITLSNSFLWEDSKREASLHFCQVLNALPSYVALQAGLRGKRPEKLVPVQDPEHRGALHRGRAELQAGARPRMQMRRPPRGGSLQGAPPLWPPQARPTGPPPWRGPAPSLRPNITLWSRWTALQVQYACRATSLLHEPAARPAFCMSLLHEPAARPAFCTSLPRDQPSA